jgi:hypothetical protein
VAVLTVAVSTSCVTDATKPGEVVMTPPNEHLRSAALAAQLHRTITLKGEQFVLDPDASVVYHNGKSIPVPAAKLAAVQDMFIQIERIDNSIAAIEKDGKYRSCLAEARRLGISLQAQLRKPKIPVANSVSITGSASKISSFGRSSLRLSSARDGGLHESPSPLRPSNWNGFTTQYGEFSCYQLSVALYDATQRWNATKELYHDIITSSAFAGSMFTMESEFGAWNFEFDERAALAWAGLNLLALETELMTGLIELNVIGTLMHQQNCIYGPDWASPTGTIGTAGGGGGTGYDCHLEYGELYLVYDDGGETQIWSGYVQVCRMMQT